MKAKIRKNTFGIKTFILSVLILIGVGLQAQESQINKNKDDSRMGTARAKTQIYADTSLTRKDTIPSWWFGAAVGGNFNFYRGSTQDVNTDLFSYPAFHDGSGLGLYVTPTIIYQNPEKIFGGMLQIGYDSRKGKFDEVTTPCNCPADLKTNLSYLTIEPSLRVAPFKSNFYLYGGPRLAFNLGKSFTYNKGMSADGLIPADPELKGDFTKMHSVVISMHIGAGYDILLSNKAKGNAEVGKTYKQVVLSPFVDFHPYFGQDPRSIETWNLTTFRVGAILKFGQVKVAPKPKPPVVIIIPVVVVPVAPAVVPKPVVAPEPVVVAVPKPVVTVDVPVNIVAAYSLYFKFDESNLDNETIKNLDALIIDLKRDSTIGIQIKSYADERGSDMYNMSLSIRRGDAVVHYLISKGIALSRINSKGLGKTIIFDNNNDGKINETNYALNRRSNLIVVAIVSK
jgi:outer membrane protein OmpA-like peptidoglycan-associated protein